MPLGIVTSSGKIGNYKTSYTIKIEKINGDTKFKNTNLIIYVKNGQNIDYGKKVDFVRRV